MVQVGSLASQLLFPGCVAPGPEQKGSDSLAKNRQGKIHSPVSVGQVSGEVL